MSIALNIELPARVMEEIARRAAALLAAGLEDTGVQSPYVTTGQAADYLCCSRQRIHDLLSQGKLSRFKEGRRTLVLRSELDELVRLGRRRRTV